MATTNEVPFTCRFCGLPSRVDPSREQSPPVDYCYPSDHGLPDFDALPLTPEQESAEARLEEYKARCS